MKRNKISYFIIIFIIMSIISFCSIQSASNVLNTKYDLLKQVIWYLIGILEIYIIKHIGNNRIIKNAWYLYIINIFLLILLLIFATPINNSKCWFNIGGITFQPSEFMKIFLIICLAKMIDKFNNNYKKHNIKDEFIFIIKVIIVLLIPAILTFLEPDTGIVLIYIIITITMLFISGIKYRWFTIGIVSIFSILAFILIFYNTDMFINIFGSSFFMRIERLLDWTNKNGYQLNNSLVLIGSAGFIGFGLNNTPIYIPEANTDFIFSVFASNFGYIGCFIFILLITTYDLLLIKLAIKTKKKINKYIIAGILGMTIYSQFQNIGMTFGLLPITGITLPFISYGGSSLLSYIFTFGLILNIEKNSN